MKIVLNIIVIIFFANVLHSQDVLIYSDDGTWEDGIIALEHFFDNQNITHNRIYAADLNANEWNKEAKAILFPGGYSYNYQLAITLAAVDSIRTYVANGGGYIGICAGAYFASKTVDWEGEAYPYELALFDGTATGSLNYVAPWPNYVMTDIKLNKQNPISGNDKSKISVLYYGGPIFTPNAGVSVDTVATWNSADNTPAVINFEYENGRVLLLGPHLEVEENSDRDGTDFASELDDIESDWDILANGYNWLINSAPTNVKETKDEQTLTLFPNPSSDFIQIENNNDYNIIGFSIFDMKGKKVIHSSNYSNLIDISTLSKGHYMIELESNNMKIIKKEFIKE